MEEGEEDLPQQNTSEARLSESTPFSAMDRGGVMVLIGTIPTFAGGVVVEDISEDVLLHATSPGIGDIFDETSPGDTGRCWSELTMPFCSLLGGLGMESVFAV